jgi:3-oxoacyl-[acyl-carrier protein] reductase
VIGFTKTWARELGPKGVRVNAVCPGLRAHVDPRHDPRRRDAEDGRQGARSGDSGQPEEIAAVYAFLASSDASYLNGAVIEVSGGIQL